MEPAAMDNAPVPEDALQANAVNWRLFMRALADEVDSLAGPGERDDMLRGVGRRMARMSPLPQVESLDALQMELNDALESLGWGGVQLHLSRENRMLLIRHVGLPRIGSLGTPHGTWLAALLEGLYEEWLALQPGGQPSLAARRIEPADGEAVVTDAVVLRYGRL